MSAQREWMLRRAAVLGGPEFVEVLRGQLEIEYLRGVAEGIDSSNQRFMMASEYIRGLGDGTAAAVQQFHRDMSKLTSPPKEG